MKLLTVALAVSALVLAACGDDSGDAASVEGSDEPGTSLTSPTGETPSAGDTGTDTAGDTGGGSGGGAADAGVQDAQAIADCIQQAGNDVAKIQACTQ